MQIDIAKAAGVIADKIGALQGLIAQIDLVISESWPLSSVMAIAPDDSKTPGATANLLPHGIATPEMWKAAVSSARNAYQSELDKLTNQLTAF